MKRILIIVGTGIVTLFFCALIGLHLWIGYDVKTNIKIAKSLYPGKAEDALIAYLLDTTHSTKERSSVAVWTLGQIHSKKALPVLRKLYKNDPKGLTCYRKHDYVLCQSNIYKAIYCIEKSWWPFYSGLNK